MKLTKVNYVYYDSANSIYKLGQSIILNLDHVVSFTKYDLGKVNKEFEIGAIYSVETITNNNGYNLKLTGEALDRLMENT
jgi:hypothetical protein